MYFQLRRVLMWIKLDLQFKFELYYRICTYVLLLKLYEESLLWGSTLDNVCVIHACSKIKIFCNGYVSKSAVWFNSILHTLRMQIWQVGIRTFAMLSMSTEKVSEVTLRQDNDNEM